MRSELDVLLDKVADPTLRANIRWQVDRLRAKKTFGLVFESHLPERVRLPEHEIRVGVRVTYRDDPASAAFEVKALKKGIATLRKVRNSDGSVLSPAQQAEVLDETARLNALVVLQRSRELTQGCSPELDHPASATDQIRTTNR